jgi:hypothetical protein
MAAPQKATKKRLVVYVDPDVYEHFESEAVSRKLSISKVAEEQILLALNGTARTGTVQHTSLVDDIRETIFTVLNDLPVDLTEILAKRIFQTDESKSHFISARASTAQSGTHNIHDDNIQNILSQSSPSSESSIQNIINRNPSEPLVQIESVPETITPENCIESDSLTNFNVPTPSIITSNPQHMPAHSGTEIMDFEAHREKQNILESTATPIVPNFPGINTEIQQNQNPISTETIPHKDLINRPSKNDIPDISRDQDMITGIPVIQHSLAQTGTPELRTQTQTVALQLKKFIEEKKISQRSFKKIYGIDITPIKSWILGTRNISANMASRLIEIMN